MSFFQICCGEGDEESKFGTFADPELAKELGWDDAAKSTPNNGERIQEYENQITRLNRHRQSSRTSRYDSEESGGLVHDRQAIFCQPLDLEASFVVPSYKKTKEQTAFLETALLDNFIVNDLSASEKTQFIGAMQMETFSAGAKIIQQGDVGDFFYIVESGVVDFVAEESMDGASAIKKSTTVGSCPAGGSFGELALLYDSPRAVSCFASKTTPVTVWKVDQTTFRYVLASHDKSHYAKLKNLIVKISIFKNLDADIVSRFVKSLTPVHWTGGKQIVQKGEEGSIFYIIQEGQVKVHDIGLGDSRVDDLILGPGDWFGERALLTGEPRAANVTTMGDVITLAMDRETFETSIGPLRGLLEREMRKQSLTAVPIFADSDVTGREMDQLVGLMQEVCYRKGQKLAELGKPYKMQLWIVRHGKLILYSGKHGKLYNLQPGDYFGDKSVKGEIGHISSHTATCEENLTTWVLTRDQIESVIGDIDRLGRVENFKKSMSFHKAIPFADLNKRKMLGAGAFGKVWLVSHDKTVKGKVETSAFALKAISKVKVIQSKLHEAVLREKELLSILEHPFILHLVASYQDEDHLYLLLPLVLGGELFSVLQHNKQKGRGLENDSAAFYVACVVESLGHFGKHSIAYRDLKLENVLIDEQGYGIVVDLGFAKVVTEKTYTLCGTPEYLAPEIILSRGHDHTVDYWAAGVLTYELIVGQSPFYKKNSAQMELFKRIVMVKYTSPAYVSDSATDLIKKLLCRNQSKRLGNLANGYVDVKQKEWFAESGITFKEIIKKEAKAPWVPTIENPFDATNFDDMSAYEKEKVSGRRLKKEEHELFKGF